MFFTFIITIISLSLFYNFLIIRKCKRHDIYLYKFCSLRREIMSYLRINHDLISKKEYKAIKQALNITNSTINLYSRNEATNLFNIRKFVKFVKNTKNLSDQSLKWIECDNKTISTFQKKLRYNIIATFFAYTPFIMTEIMVNFLYLLGLFFVRIHIQKLKKWGSRFLDLNENFYDINSSRKKLFVN